MTPFLWLRVPVKYPLVEVRGAGLVGHVGRDLLEDALHHSQMLEAAVRVEEHEAEGQLKYDATNGPYVAGVIPSWLRLLSY